MLCESSLFDIYRKTHPFQPLISADYLSQVGLFLSLPFHSLAVLWFLHHYCQYLVTLCSVWTHH